MFCAICFIKYFKAAARECAAAIGLELLCCRPKDPAHCFPEGRVNIGMRKHYYCIIVIKGGAGGSEWVMKGTIDS
jgi:hypothetical protein